MCGRFTLRTNPREFAEILRVARELSFDWQPAYNIAPTQSVVCVRDKADREFFKARWGLLPPWTKDPKTGATCINARVETIAEKPTFRSAFRKKRCLVIADGFYEWETITEGKKAVKRPHYISLKSGEQMIFAGLWEEWNSPDGLVESCTICTTSANDFMGRLHDRMPIILPQHSIDHWLDPKVTDPEELKPLLLQFPGEEMQEWEVTKDVGNVRNQGPQLIEPLSPPEPLLF